MPANGPDCAWHTEPDTDATNNVTTANISRLLTARVSAVRRTLLPRRFPVTAARYARRCAIPFSRAGIAAEVAVGIGAADRDPHNAFPSDAAANVCPGGRNFTVRDGI